MTSNFGIEFEWESPHGARGPELRATWARLSILVDGEPVTQVEDLKAHSNRSAVYCPLYPVAEWAACNWWSLLYEVSSPRRSESNGYLLRHNLASASEGFALPNLHFRSEGESVRLEWKPFLAPSCGVRFLSSGTATVRRKDLEEALALFIAGVVARLQQETVLDTHLSEEWQNITEADPEEKQFCIAAAQLGCDPYALGEGAISQTILRLGNSLPTNLLGEFLAAASHAEIEAESESVESFLSQARSVEPDLPALREIKCRMEAERLAAAGLELPWDQGYAFAEKLRKVLGIAAGRAVGSVAELGSLFDSGEVSWRRAISERPAMRGFLNAAVATAKDGSPYIGVAKHHEHESGRVFTLCRSLYEYLATDGDTAAVVTQVRSEAQKRNRAFAAEFIVPSDELRSRIQQSAVTDEQIQDLALEFKTSDFVVRHQIQNHGIARIWDS